MLCAARKQKVLGYSTFCSLSSSRLLSIIITMSLHVTTHLLGWIQEVCGIVPENFLLSRMQHTTYNIQDTIIQFHNKNTTRTVIKNNQPTTHHPFAVERGPSGEETKATKAGTNNMWQQNGADRKDGGGDVRIKESVDAATIDEEQPAPAPPTKLPSTTADDVPIAGSDPAGVPLCQQRKKCVLVLSLLAILIILSGIGIGGYCAATGSCKKSAVPPGNIATSNRTSTIVAEINNITLSGRKLAYPPTVFAIAASVPEELALQWLIESDPLKLLTVATEPDKFRLRQRYALLTLWFYTMKKPWTNSSGWLALDDECRWFGITCKATDLGGGTGLQNAVAGIGLQNNTLNGAIPADLGLLTSLQSFDVPHNSLTETLPVSIGLWTALQLVDVSVNELTGTLPVSIGQWTALQSLDMSANGLTGTLPASMVQWTALQQFSVYQNSLNGTLPASIGQ
jgi:Leucine-rich repeat (LRR) protein